MIPTPPDEDFNYCILAIMLVVMLFASSNWVKFLRGEPLGYVEAQPERLGCEK